MARLPIEHMKRPEAPITVVDVDEARRLLGCVRGARIHRAVTTRASACSSTPACGWSSSRTSRWMTSTRCLRMPRRHPRARESALRLGERGHGPMTDNGVAQVLQRGGREVVVDNLHAHQFRHTFAHSRLSEGGNEGNLMRLAGGRSRQMLGRYGASAATSAPSKPAAAWPPTTGGTSLKARTEPCPHFLLA